MDIIAGFLGGVLLVSLTVILIMILRELQEMNREPRKAVIVPSAHSIGVQKALRGPTVSGIGKDSTAIISAMIPIMTPSEFSEMAERNNDERIMEAQRKAEERRNAS